MSTADTHHGKKSFIGRIGHFLIIAAYLWLLLVIYTLHNAVVLSDWQIAAHLGATTLKALVLAKFVLIGEHLKLGSRAEHLPLAWVVLIKAALFAALLIGFNIVEELLVAAIWPHEGAESGEALALSGAPTAISLTLMAFVALIPFFGISELTRVLGEKPMRDLFFRSRP